MYTNTHVADCTVTNEDYAKRAAELGHGIISTCEHGEQGRYVEGYELAQKYNLKFVFSVEAYWVKDRLEKDRSNCHIFIAAKNENGRQAINDVLSEANITGFYGQPRVDLELLKSLPSEDVIVTTACIAYWKYDEIEEITLELAKHFKYFFLEVQYHNTQKQIDLNQRILRLSQKANIPIIMGCDSHYIFPKGAQERADFVASKGMVYDDEEGWYMDYPDGDEAYRRFAKQGVLNHSQIMSAMENTNIFLSVEEYDNPCFNHDIKMPTLYPQLSQEERDKKYLDLIHTLWEKEKPNVPEDRWAFYESEIKKETDIVLITKHADYFLMDYAIVCRGKELGGVITSTGRGSAPSFYTNKLLGITDVDRIASPVKMYPERFMSPTRILETKSIADLDMNLDHPEIFAQAQTEILGGGHSYPMRAYGTMKPKAAWKMYAKSQNIDFETSNIISERIDAYEDALKHAEEDEKDLIDINDYIDPAYREIFAGSEAYRGIVSHHSPHPCAYLIYTGDIRKEIGLVRIKDKICCVMDGLWAEQYKFLKNDLLKVSVVEMIDKTYKRIGIPKHTVNELIAICTPDHPAWNMYKIGCTLGLNQVEKPGTSNRVGKYKPQNISELCAFVAAIRPGFKSMYKTFEAREHFDYGVPTFDKLIQTLEMPNSFVLYQEQSMATLNFAGIPLAECYEAIKNIAKKRVEKVLKYKERFLEGFAAKLIESDNVGKEQSVEIANRVWTILEDSSRYSFNACVSASTRLINSNGTVSAPLSELVSSTPEKSLSLCEDGCLRENQIIGIYNSGTADLYTVITDTCNKISCTVNHTFPTTKGMKALSLIDEDDEIYIAERCSDSWEVKKAHILDIQYSGKGEVYDVEMADPYHNFVTDGGVVTGNSHAYSVAIDSLYCAYLKAIYPMQFYETFLRILEDKGDKDKMNAVKEEASNYFGIKFVPYKFGQDNRQISADVEKKEMTKSLASIKGFGSAVGDIMFDCAAQKFSYFADVLCYLARAGIKESKTEPLIKIDFFKDFGNIPSLLQILTYCEDLKYGEAKQVNSEKADTMGDVISLYASNLGAKGKVNATWKISDCMGLLRALEMSILEKNLPDMSIRAVIKNSTEFLGYSDVITGKPEDRRNCMVTSKPIPMKSKKTGEVWGHRVDVRSIGTGVSVRVTVPPYQMEIMPIKEGDLIRVESIPKSKSGYYKLEYYTYLED